MRPTNKKPAEIYKVEWLSKDSSIVLSKTFEDYDLAIDFSKTNKYSLVYKKGKDQKDTIQWIIVPTRNAREMVKNIKIKKALDKKNMFYNADGISQMETTTTTQAKASQNVRLFSIFAFTPVIVYAGMQKALPQWLRYSLFTVAGLNIITNLKNYKTNRDIEKSIDQEIDED